MHRRAALGVAPNASDLSLPCATNMSILPQERTFLTAGLTSVNWLLPTAPRSVLKLPGNPEDAALIEAEHEIYTRLGTHSHIAHYLGRPPELTEPDWTPHKTYHNGLCLEYYPHGTLRSYLSLSGAPSLGTLRSASQLAAALTHIHACGVVHCDLSCNNVFIDNGYNLRVADFAGSSIDGCEPGVWYETRCARPYDETIPREENDIFAAGTLLYEISTGKRLWDNVDDQEVERRFRAGEWPDVKGLLLGEVVVGCWTGRITTAVKLGEELGKMEDSEQPWWAVLVQLVGNVRVWSWFRFLWSGKSSGKSSGKCQ